MVQCVLGRRCCETCEEKVVDEDGRRTEVGRIGGVRVLTGRYVVGGEERSGMPMVCEALLIWNVGAG
jgi:hypothetical protein